MTSTYIGTVRNGKVEFERPLALPEGSQVRVTLSPVLNERQAAGKANVWLANQVGDAVVDRVLADAAMLINRGD